MAARARTSKRSRSRKAAEDTGRAGRSSGVASRRGARTLPEFQPPPNDNISNAFDRLGLVPARYRGSDKFLDVVTWNIRFFHDQDSDRVKRVVNILSELNADIIVLQEIRDESLEVVSEQLRRIEAGYYTTAYGTTGGDQRVAMMYDLDWVRAKDDIQELFGKGTIIASDGKDAFPRLPLLGHFTAFSQDNPFDFQLLGVHLKSQRGGGDEQRLRSAQELAKWLTSVGPTSDADIIVLGDWNQPPSSKAWEPLRQLEAGNQLKFSQINNESEISHLMYQSKTKIGSRLDLNALSMSAAQRMGKPPAVVQWAPLEEFLGSDPKAAQIKDFLKGVRDSVSDHLPVVTRFYFHDDRK